MSNKRVIAVYLPQFHPFKENDEWWGKGFTEWRNVAMARPRFKGHYQPRNPGDLGYYDLRVSDTREAQSKMAREAGIDGFCVYHYWFTGHQLMQRPMEEVLASGKPDFPFMLCWANENWTRAWDGMNKEVLIEQKYSEEDDHQHARFLIEHYFKDPRYIRVDGKPMFIFYRSTLFPNMKRTLEIFREEAAKDNMKLYLCRFERPYDRGMKLMEDGFDAAVDFAPHWLDYFSWKSPYMKKKQLELKLRGHLRLNQNIPTVLKYDEFVDHEIATGNDGYRGGGGTGATPVSLQCGTTLHGESENSSLHSETVHHRSLVSGLSIPYHISSHIHHRKILCSSTHGTNGRKETTLSRTSVGATNILTK